MTILKQIISPIKDEINSFNKKLDIFFTDTDVELLRDVASHVLKSKGKQIRPILVFLVAKMLSDKVTPTDYNNAIFVETLHLSSLIHDDIVDKADYRRNRKTVNNIWGNSIAVLLGDYMFSLALQKSMENDNFQMLKIGTEVISNMSKGEFLQKEKSETLDTTIDDYMKIILWKTSSLLEACTKSAAIVANIDDNSVEEIKLFGRYVGYIFQMKDDLLDYTNSDTTGKPSDADLIDRKITIPLLLAFEGNSSQVRENIVEKIKSDNNGSYVAEIKQFVIDNKGIEKTYSLMESYKDKAYKILSNYKDSDSKQSLMKLVNFFISRDK